MSVVYTKRSLYEPRCEKKARVIREYRHDWLVRISKNPEMNIAIINFEPGSRFDILRRCMHAIRESTKLIIDKHESEPVSENRLLDLGAFLVDMDMIVGFFSQDIRVTFSCMVYIAEHKMITFRKLSNLFIRTSEHYAVHVYWQIATAQIHIGMRRFPRVPDAVKLFYKHESSRPLIRPRTAEQQMKMGEATNKIVHGTGRTVSGVLDTASEVERR